MPNSDEHPRTVGLGERIAQPESALREPTWLTHGALEALGWVTLAVALAVALIAAKRPGGLFWSELFNVAHVVLSGVVVLVSIRLTIRLLTGTCRAIWLQYGLALGLATALGASLEVVQIFGLGEASWRDIARDFLGALAAILLAASFDRRFRQELTRSWVRIWSLRVVAGGLLCLCLIPLARVMTAMAYRRWAFPSLCSFDSRWDQQFAISDDGALLVLASPPNGFSRARGPLAGKVTFSSESMYPKLALVGPLGDWSAYRTLAFEIFSPENASVTLTLRVHDRKHQNRYADRFNTEFSVYPGENSIAVPLADIRKAPSTRAMDMAAIAGLAVLAHSPERSFTLYLDEFRLE